MFEQDFEQLLRQYETALDDKKKIYGISEGFISRSGENSKFTANGI